MLKPFTEHQPDTEDETIARDLTETIANVAEFLNQLESIEFLDGRRIEGISMSAATNKTIKHKLNRTPRGWWTTDLQTALTRPVRRVSWNATDLVLYAEDACTIDIWVF